MKTVSLRLPEVVAAQLAATARKRGQSKSAVARAALAQGLAEDGAATPGSCLELAADLAGCIEGARDLSVHERHLQGYGR